MKNLILGILLGGLTCTISMFLAFRGDNGHTADQINSQVPKVIDDRTKQISALVESQEGMTETLSRIETNLSQIGALAPSSSPSKHVNQDKLIKHLDASLKQVRLEISQAISSSGGFRFIEYTSMHQIYDKVRMNREDDVRLSLAGAHISDVIRKLGKPEKRLDYSEGICTLMYPIIGTQSKKTMFLRFNPFAICHRVEFVEMQ